MEQGTGRVARFLVLLRSDSIKTCDSRRERINNRNNHDISLKRPRLNIEYGISVPLKPGAYPANIASAYILLERTTNIRLGEHYD
jgi:hypothetical protein